MPERQKIMSKKSKRFMTACILILILIFSISSSGCRTVPVYGFVSSDPNALDLVRTQPGAIVTQADGTVTKLPKAGRWASDDFWEKALKAVKFGKD